MYPETSPILNFTVVDMHNPLIIGIADISFYPSGFTVTNPTLEITPPSFAKVVKPYTAGEINVFTSNDLNITCVGTVAQLTDLPDGIWTIRQSISPAIQWNVEKSFIRTEILQQKFGRAFLKADLMDCNLSGNRENMKALDEIYFYIQSSIAAANECNYILAMNLYRTANSMLDNFLKGRCRGTTQTLWC
jgi:hypothetical protein